PHQAAQPWHHLREGDLNSIVECLREVAGVGAGGIAALASVVSIALVGFGLFGPRPAIPATQEIDGAPLPRWCGWFLVGAGFIGAAALYFLVPRLFFGPLGRMLAARDYSAADIERELHLLHVLLVGFALAGAAVGVVLLGWQRLLRVAERLPQW